MVKLTNEEFIALYKGLCRSFSTVVSAVEKVYGFVPFTMEVIDCHEQFKKEIDNNRPDLVKLMKKLGDYEKTPNVDEIDQLNDYLERFKEIIGDQEIEVENLKFEMDEEIEE